MNGRANSIWHGPAAPPRPEDRRATDRASRDDCGRGGLERRPAIDGPAGSTGRLRLFSRRCRDLHGAGGTALLDIGVAEMAGIRAASEPYAALLARRMRERLGATWGLAESGASGPSGNRYGDPAGHSCFAVSGPTERTLTLRTASADRQANMRAFSSHALALVAEVIGA